MDEAHEMELGHEAQGLQEQDQQAQEIQSLRAQLATAQAELARVTAEMDGAKRRLDLERATALMDAIDPETVALLVPDTAVGLTEIAAALRKIREDKPFLFRSHPTPEGKPC